MAEKIYDAQEIIFTKGDPSEFAYLIKVGEVEILEGYPEEPVRLATLGAGEIFGEMGLVDERPRSLTARAVAHTEAATITRDQFIDLILHKPEEAFKYLGMFFERLRAMNMRVAQGEEVPSKLQTVIEEVSVSIFPATRLSEDVIAPSGLEIKNFPFRVGRAARHRIDPLNVNDILLPDSQPFNVSRNHFSIEKTNEGVFVQDRGSYLGTIVNGAIIGGHHKGAWIELRGGENEVIAGSSQSPFKFHVFLDAG